MDGVDRNGTGEGSSLTSCGYGSQSQVGSQFEDMHNMPHQQQGHMNNPSSGVYGYTGAQEGDQFGSVASSQSRPSSNDFRMELQSMINSMNTISASLSSNANPPPHNPPHNGRPSSSFSLRHSDPLYDIPEGLTLTRDGEVVEDLGESPERIIISDGQQFNTNNFSNNLNNRVYNRTPDRVHLPSPSNNLAHGSGIAYLRQNRNNRHSLQHSTSFDSGSFMNGSGNVNNGSNSSDYFVHNNNGRAFYGDGGSGPESLPLDMASASIRRQHSVSSYIPVLDGRTLFHGEGNRNINSQGSGIGSGTQQHQNYSNNNVMHLHRNNSLPRPHSIAAPTSSFMQYRMKRDLKRDFV